MKVKATVVYPVYLEIETGKEALKSKEQKQKIRERIFELAENLFESSSVKPLIHECSIPDLID